MTAYYIESSAMVKRYAKEKGTNFLIGLLRPSAKNFLYSVKITEVEVCAALARRRQGLSLTVNQTAKSTSRFRRIFAKRFFAIDVTDQIIDEAIRLADNHILRDYDAVQLSAASLAARKRLNDGLTTLVFVSADKEFKRCGTSRRFDGRESEQLSVTNIGGDAQQSVFRQSE